MKQEEINELIEGGIDLILGRDNLEDSLKIHVKNNKNKKVILDLKKEDFDSIGNDLILLNKKRTDILFLSIELEKTIDFIIQNILFNSKRDENSVLFDAFFMKSNYVTFFNKWKILKELLKSHSRYSHLYDSELFKNIKELIGVRNSYSHGEVYYSYEDKAFYLKYFKNDKIKKDKLIKDFFNKVNGSFQYCNKKLNEISNEITQNINKINKG